MRAGLKSFAEYGYAATSVQHIVDAAQVSKPALYYYFRDKADLFQALVDEAHDERLRVMEEAAGRRETIAEKLEEIVAATFEFSQRNRELMRLAFSTAFAASGEAPGHVKCREKGRRNFEFVRSVIEQAQGAGELNSGFDTDELTMGIYGQLNNSIMLRLLAPECPMYRQTPRQTARQMVRLYLEGASPRKASSARRKLAAVSIS